MLDLYYDMIDLYQHMLDLYYDMIELEQQRKKILFVRCGVPPFKL